MNYFDAIFIIAFLWSAYRGITKGFIIMLASLAALILGVWGAIHFSDLTSGFLIDKFNFESQYLHIISFAITFILIVIAVHLVARAVDKLIKAVALGFVNRIAGLIFGIAKTAFIISIILVVVNSVDRKLQFIPEEHKENSLLYQPLSRLAPAIFPYLDFNDIRERVDRSAEDEIET
jgi:membrane protein required for colicin V production